MKAYDNLIEECGKCSSYFSVPDDEEWIDEAIGRSYLEKYFLPEEEYREIWQPLQNAIFQYMNEGCSDRIIRPDYALMPLWGGHPFDEEWYDMLRDAAMALGDRHLIVIQNGFGETTDERPLFRMKFPVETSWDEFVSGGFVSDVLTYYSYNEYFVFGESGNWGLYCATDTGPIIHLLGFRPDLAPVFKKHFRLLPGDVQDLRNAILTHWGWYPKDPSLNDNVIYPDDRHSMRNTPRWIQAEVGMIFVVPMENGQRYFQYVAPDGSKDENLYAKADGTLVRRGEDSGVIRVFKEVYPLGSHPDLQRVVCGETDFHARVFFMYGVLGGYWQMAGMAPVRGPVHAIFRAALSFPHNAYWACSDPASCRETELFHKWMVWDAGAPKEKELMNRLDAKGRQAEVGTLIGPANIIHRMKTGKYTGFYPAPD